MNLFRKEAYKISTLETQDILGHFYHHFYHLKMATDTFGCSDSLMGPNARYFFYYMFYL